MDAPGRVPTAINCHSCSQVVDLTGLEGFTEAECPYCHSLLVVPVEFGNFLLLHAQGVGGMGTVYRAMDMALHRYVALKVLKPGLAANPEFIESFSREARAAASVTHINVAQVYTFGEQEGHYFIAMELLEKGSLDDRIVRRTRLPEAEVLDIGLQIAAGLSAAYERGLLHRDVKPGNILFDAEGVPKVVDFGLARGRDVQAAKPEGNAPQQVWGTPYYIAPEKMRGHADDLRSDIYSLGATLFHALAGRPPFEAATATDVALKHTTQPAVSLKAFVPGIQDATAQTIGRMLAKNPAERYHSYAELTADLEAAKIALQTAVAQPTIVTDSGERVSMKTVVATISVLVAVVVLIILAIIFRERLFGVQPPPAPPTPAVPTPGKAPPPAPVEFEVTFKIEMPWGKQWQIAGNEAGQGNLDQARQAFDGVRKMVRDLPTHQPWVDCYEGLVLLGFERQADAAAAFARATNRLTSVELPATITTTNFVSLFAAGMLDPALMTSLERAATRMPPWAAGVTFLGSGLKHLQAGDLPRATGALHAYDRLPFGEQRRWIFVLQPLAARLAGECDAAIKALNDSAKQQKQNNHEAALATIRAALNNAKLAPVQAQLREREALIQKAVDEARRRQEQEDQKAAAAKLAAEQQRAAEEVKIVQTVEPSVMPLWMNWNFAGAAAQYEEAGRQLQSPAAKAQIEQRLAVMKVLGEFKHQLIADIARKPYDRGDLQTRQNLALTGKLTRANDRELVFVLAFGEMVVPWTDFAPTTIGKLADYYVQTLGALDRPEAAGQRQLRLAVYCKQFGLERFVAGYVQQAVKQQPALQAEVKKLIGAPAQ